MLKRGLVHLVLGGAMMAASATGAVAAPASGLGVTTAMPATNLPIEQVYWYGGHYYPYRWHGGYYRYRWNGAYYRYRWHGGYYNYYWHGRYYLHRRWQGGIWVYW
jgi:hypothetical protein